MKGADGWPRIWCELAARGIWAGKERVRRMMKAVRLHGMRFDTRRLAKDEVIGSITFHNHRRLHSTLGYTSPMACEQKWLA